MSVAETGAQLAERYHRDVVGPLLLARWPQLSYAAARLGSGSDVLGLDDELSRDHDWGLRLDVLVAAELVGAVNAHLEESLPATYEGRPARFVTTWSEGERAQTEVGTARDLAVFRLGLDPRDGLDPVAWLGLTGQSVLEVVAGPVFVDTAGELTRIRQALRWYPDDVWRYVLAADWNRLAEEMPLAGRAGQRGDDTGSRVVMARLVRTTMHLGFLLERSWPPYAKWLGTAYARLPVAGPTADGLARALGAASWRDREGALVEVLETLLDRQGRLGLPRPDRATGPFWDRPFRTVVPDVAALLLAEVTDPAVQRLPPGV
ncbi:MAG TPA: DUF4037 domain-containing protein, partial [Lapillicoccus sp.]|nr:DUF4037 domain-containing protein [Lapillicoccus sp.]